MGPAVGRTYGLSVGDTIIGRAPDAEVVIAADDVSRRHARIWAVNGTFFIEDLGSRNGTLVNGVAVARRCLAVGDRIEVGGSTVLRFELLDERAVRAERLQRLAVMSELTAGLAHDFRNLLTVVAGNAGLLEHLVHTTYAGDDDLKELVADLSGSVDAALELMRRLFEFARRDATSEKATAVPLRPIVNEVLTLLRRSLPSSVDVLVDVEDQLQVLSSRGEMCQIITNLCLNARDAMPEGGWLEIRATARSLTRQEASSLLLDGAGDFVELKIVDTGIGMDASTLARVFEPFFTTKLPGKGSGLGLASVYGLVRSRGGNVFAESSPGAGATFRVFLPSPPTETLRRHSPTVPAERT
ncbi:MAG TPA: ATP-binding protein [Kofleriaceae bacterium]|nr:ATP-binding protein [Kofleriaceae bacterium]